MRWRTEIQADSPATLECRLSHKRGPLFRERTPGSCSILKSLPQNIFDRSIGKWEGILG
jgi:hypothetical protein